MLEHELEEMIGENVTDTQYRVMCRVYENYPGIKDKYQLVDLFKIGGWNLIYDMYPRAERLRQLEEKRRGIVDEMQRIREAPIWGINHDWFECQPVRRCRHAMRGNKDGMDRSE